MTDTNTSAVDRATALIRAFIVDSAGWDGGEVMTVQARELAAQLADDGLITSGGNCKDHTAAMQTQG